MPRALRAALLALLLTLGLLTPTQAEAATPTRWMIFGDSIVEGCCYTNSLGKGASIPVQDRIGGTIAEKLGWPYPNTQGSGGTGYLTAGPVAGRQSYQNRIGAVLEANPGQQVLVIEGGSNDPISDPAAFRAAVRRTYSIAREKLPTARIYVLGPYSQYTYTNPTKLGIIREEAARAGFPFVDISPYMTTHAAASGWLWTDKFHPNYTGHYVLGSKAADGLRAVGA